MDSRNTLTSQTPPLWEEWEASNTSGIVNGQRLSAVCSQSVRFVERVRISSTWDRAPRNSPFMLSPRDLYIIDFNSKRIRSITRRKSTGDNTEP